MFSSRQWIRTHNGIAPSKRRTVIQSNESDRWVKTEFLGPSFAQVRFAGLRGLGTEGREFVPPLFP